jgi:hypothetical protein
MLKGKVCVGAGASAPFEQQLDFLVGFFGDVKAVTTFTAAVGTQVHPLHDTIPKFFLLRTPD